MKGRVWNLQPPPVEGEDKPPSFSPREKRGKKRESPKKGKGGFLDNFSPLPRWESAGIGFRPFEKKKKRKGRVGGKKK